MYKKLDEKTMHLILETGIDQFARFGLDRANINTIAKAAGVSVGVLYKYFGDKDSFFLACVRHSLAQLDQVLQEAVAHETDIESGIRSIISALIVHAREHQCHNALYNEITSGSCRKYAGTLAREIESRTAALYTRLFDGAQQGGQLTERIEPQLFAFFFDNLLMMLQFSYSCEYYQERMRIFCGEAALEDTKMADRLTRFLLGAMKGDVCSISSLTTSERPESRPACSEPNRISG